MSNLKNIREKFGLSQQQVAHWLGISRSLAEHYERGIRNLPTHALLQMAKLEMMVVEFEKDSESGSWGTNHGDMNHGDTDKRGTKTSDSNLGIANTNEAIINNGAAVPLHPKMAFELVKVERLQQQLSVLKGRHTILQQQMQLIKKMIDNCNEQTSEKEKLWLQMLYHGVSSKLTKFDEGKQLPLKAKIIEMRMKHEFMKSRAL